MFSTRKDAKGEKHSQREGEKQAFALNFLVHGSSVPIHSQQSKTVRECRSCQNASKGQKKKEFSFPVDKIIYLSKKLELMSLTEKKTETISLSAMNIDPKNSLEESRAESRVKRKEMKLGSRISSRSFDFSLDLSCISNTGDESDENFDTSEKGTFSYYNSESPCSLASVKKICEKSQQLGRSDRNFVHSFPDKCERRKSSSDSINVYVNTVNKRKDLVKYFRACRTCKELSCVCPHPSSLFGNSPKRYTKGVHGETYEINESNEGIGGDGQFACECASCPLYRKKVCPIECCCPGILEFDFYHSLGKEECGCRSDSVDSDPIAAYTSTLANAARTARVLARDLEFISSALSNVTE